MAIYLSILGFTAAPSTIPRRFRPVHHHPRHKVTFAGTFAETFAQPYLGTMTHQVCLTVWLGPDPSVPSRGDGHTWRVDQLACPRSGIYRDDVASVPTCTSSYSSRYFSVDS
ncbi:hypothetical protein B0T19DRAFT_395279 [Cercophora scortea]|uniref:Uncharacterized protein n=1 Tax=Cercophora scortea TaxID=314031 RepID=A0AAE0MK06_9PEZI|nr:hypothetical protein B0T19DRAFT_395279 [Cercophora scortea]